MLVLFLLPVVLAFNCAQVAPGQRSECGFRGITQEQCVRRNCCYDPSPGEGSATPWCFQRTASASWRNEDGTLRSAVDRRLFVQGEWDERRRSRGGNIPRPRQLNEAQATVYEAGVAAWRKRGAHTPSTDARVATSYVPGTWPAMCPSNGMSPDTILRFLGTGGVGPVNLTTTAHLVRRVRQCNKVTGCTNWVVNADDGISDSAGMTGVWVSNGGKNYAVFGRISLSMYIQGQELFYKLGMYNGALNKWCGSDTGVIYSPNTPYSFRSVPRGSKNPSFPCTVLEIFDGNTLQFDSISFTGAHPENKRPLVLAGSIGNSCISLFSDIKVDGNQEQQFAIYGTW